MWQTWLIIAGLCLIIEAITVGFLVFWFAIGAIIAMIVSFVIPNIIVQSVVFLVSSTVLVLCTRKLVNKFIPSENVPTNVYSEIGKRGIVTLDIDPKKGTGQIKVNGNLWTARCDEEILIPKDTEIEVIRIDGVKAFVKLV